jgi:hypothetical protein
MSMWKRKLALDYCESVNQRSDDEAVHPSAQQLLTQVVKRYSIASKSDTTSSNVLDDILLPLCVICQNENVVHCDESRPRSSTNCRFLNARNI